MRYTGFKIKDGSVNNPLGDMKGDSIKLDNKTNIQELLKSKREEIIAVAKKHGARNVRVFGSVVRGDDNNSSDVDFLVDLGDNLSFFFPGGLIIELEQLLGRKVDIVTAKSLKIQIKEEIMKEAVNL